MKNRILLIWTTIISLTPSANVMAAEYFHLDKMPRLNISTTEGLFNGLYMIAISLAAILVTLRLIYAGVQYMFSEVITSKAKAKEDIKNALLGLLIILGAVTILNTINPQVTKLGVFDGLDPTETPPPLAGTSGWTQTAPSESDAKNIASTCGGQAQILPIVDGGLVNGGGYQIKCYSDANAPSEGPTSCSDGHVLQKRIDNGKTIRYCVADTRNSGRSNCDGYYNPSTNSCYGSEIELSDEFDNQPHNIRRDECSRVGGEYDNSDGTCRWR